MKPDPIAPSRPPAPRVHPVTRWHRLLGISSILIVLVTVATGFVLNHSDALALSTRHPDNALVDGLYGQRAAHIANGFDSGRGWLAQAGGHVFLDGHELAQHQAPLRGALTSNDALVLLYADALVEYDAAFSLVATYDELDGLRPPLQRLGVSHARLVVEAGTGSVQIDLTDGSIAPVTVTSNINWSAPVPLPSAQRAALAQAYRGFGVSYERLLLDLHSGRLFGRGGVLLVDGAALCLLVLALSGAYMWFKFKRTVPRAPTVRPPPPTI